jgi:PEP-CTERM motif-containing protein
MRKLVMGLAGAAALAFGSTQASASAIITFNTTNGVPSNNDFQGNLAGLGLTLFTTDGATISLTENSVLTFDFFGSESGFNDTFQAGAINFTEMSSFTPFGAQLLGADSFLAGSLAGLLNFSSASGPGANATVGQDGFGIFLGANAVSGLSTNVFWLGYDDQITNVDDNHDDMLIRVTVSPAVPEPATWAMMLLGFGAAGFVLRRRRAPVLAQAA